MVKGSGIAFQNGDQTLQAVLCGVGGQSFGAGHTVAAEADDGFAASLGIVFGNGNACAVVLYTPSHALSAAYHDGTAESGCLG